MVDLSQEDLLDTLSSVHNILMLSKNWSQSSSCFKDGKPCKPVDADQWSLLGTIEKVLVSQDKYDALPQVIAELEKDNAIAVSDFDEQHSHRELLEYLYNTLDRVAESLGYNMYAPLFPVEDNVEEDSYGLFFIPKEFDEELERAEREAEDRYNEHLLEEAKNYNFSED